ncbi:hypothetical protein K4H00_25415, partial [Mycobacterium tuberculosis]|nr:hypothetical protein [Mycobacterium tuberculosis]
ERTMPRFASAPELHEELDRVPQSVWTVREPEPGRTSAEGVLFLDSFTRGLRPAVAGAAARVLGGAHTSVACTADQCCGLTHV